MDEAEAETSDDEVFVKTEHILEWLDSKIEYAKPLAALAFTEVKVFILEGIARHHKEKRHEAFTLPNFEEREE